MIRIKEEKPDTADLPKIYINMENKFELIQDSYPVFIKPKNLTLSEYHASVLEKQ
ncbi:MAG TPA: hypothetical protein VFT71_01785 [Candidatus Nitrosocosmicus sp.]|nr:hypothetical protein [Candidatus Nitrosocosmicus sp.]HEX5905040.1 hypothetical protein [Candidatus Nitrosocosmicus sp.]